MNSLTYLFIFIFSWGLLARAATVEIPSAQAIEKWVDPKYTTSKILPDEVPAKVIDCENKDLYPTHPQQSLKLYHLYLRGVYRAQKIAANDEVCIVTSRHQDPAKRFCIATDTVEHVILSDTYQDSCGHFYRGFVETAYLHKQETIASLVSRGRTLDRDDTGPYGSNWVVAWTYPVEEQVFLQLTELFPGDLEKITQLRAEALKQGFSIRPDGTFWPGPIRALSTPGF